MLTWLQQLVFESLRANSWYQNDPAEPGGSRFLAVVYVVEEHQSSSQEDLNIIGRVDFLELKLFNTP